MKKLIIILTIIAAPWWLSAQTMTIGDGAVTTIGVGASLSVGTAASSGTLYSDANTKLIIESTASGSGSLICGGTPNATVERYVDKNAWHLVTPITNASTANDFYIDASNDSWLVYHQESDNSFDNYITDLGTSLTRNQGYGYWIDNAASANTVNFTGTLIGANQTPTVLSSGNDYNLLGNPFPSAIDFASGSWSTTNMEETVWIWNQGNGNYSYSNGQGDSYSGTGTAMGNGIIPMGQGFFVKAKNNNVTVTIPADARVHNTQAFYKKSTEQYSGDLQHIYLGVSDNLSKDGVFVSFAEDATTAMDDGWDVSKYFGNENAVQLYLIEEGRKQSIDHLPLLVEGESKTIELNLRVGNTGEHTINTKNYNFDNFSVVLEDLQTSTTQDLKIKPIYIFNSSIGDNPERFLLHFAWSPDGIGEDFEDASSNISIYAYGNDVYIHSREEAINQSGNVFVYDLMGRVLAQKEIMGSELIKFPVNTSNNYVVVKIVKDNSIKTKKVYIK